jgi:hypothetical protein
MDIHGYQIIGAGGFGKIFLLPGGSIVLKAISNKDICISALTEFRKQEKAFQAFNSIRNVRFAYDLLNNFKDKIIVSKPISYSDIKTSIDGTTYACYYVMRRLNGIPLWMYQECDPNSLKTFLKITRIIFK